VGQPGCRLTNEYPETKSHRRTTGSIEIDAAKQGVTGLNLRVQQLEVGRHRVAYTAEIDFVPTAFSIWYPDVDLFEVREAVGQSLFMRIVAHIVAFEINKNCSLGVTSVDLGPLDGFVDASLIALWDTLYENIWAQWRFENQLPLRPPPDFIRADQVERQYGPSNVALDGERQLAFFSGGKDSYVGLRLLQRAEIPFDLLLYTSSIYGTRSSQLNIIELATNVFPSARLRMFSVFDEFMDAPVRSAYPSSVPTYSLVAGETPSSIFESIPIALSGGYSQIALSHERSADDPNLYWEAESKWINHQWGKSSDARATISDYLKSHLVSGIHYYSILEALSDPVIFMLLAEEPWKVVRGLSSCNVAKPWCRRCPKCVYVWLNYLAYMKSPSDVATVFHGEDLFAIPENLQLLTELAGMTLQKPFECVGSARDVRIALALCLTRGLGVGVVEHLLDGVSKESIAADLRESLTVDPTRVSRSQAPVALQELLMGDVKNWIEAESRTLLTVISTLDRLPEN
jgi:UDP-N-acetyl-alpha-D-muramoyl-L-alanyl-L-glutamate epimerase